MASEKEVLEKFSNPRLKRNILPREAKKLNMEFDAQYNTMSKEDRDAFLDNLYPEEKSNEV